MINMTINMRMTHGMGNTKCEFFRIENMNFSYVKCELLPKNITIIHHTMLE